MFDCHINFHKFWDKQIRQAEEKSTTLVEAVYVGSTCN